MRAIVQRVSEAHVRVADGVCGQVNGGVLVYLGVATDDTAQDAEYLAEKVRYLRLFPEGDKHLNRDLLDAGGAALVVSAFTLQADARKGRRPSFDHAAPPELANQLYEHFCTTLAGLGVPVERGQFRAEMAVGSVNAGPVCILLDSKRVF